MPRRTISEKRDMKGVLQGRCNAKAKEWQRGTREGSAGLEKAARYSKRQRGTREGSAGLEKAARDSKKRVQCRLVCAQWLREGKEWRVEENVGLECAEVIGTFKTGNAERDLEPFEV
eukprot:4619602-Pleurochrysis_carterae.AAC.3